MDISKFIEETLTGIKNGIQAANEKLSDNEFHMMREDKVDFDVALMVIDKTEGKTEAKVGIASFLSVGGDVAIENQNSKTSRIKFSVQISHNLFGAAKRQ